MEHHVWVRDLEQESLDEYKIRYINKIIPSQNLAEALHSSFEMLMAVIGNVDESTSTYSYMEGKWDVKTLLLHICDTERVFQYRSLCLARDNTMMLTPFDENVFAKNCFAQHRTFDNIKEEFGLIHESGLALYNSISRDSLLSPGNFNGQRVSTALFGFLISGHRLHHLEVLKTKYLK